MGLIPEPGPSAGHQDALPHNTPAPSEAANFKNLELRQFLVEFSKFEFITIQMSRSAVWWPRALPGS